jgi:hypothetical protein
MGKRPSLFSVSPPREFTFHRKPLRVFTHEQGPRFVAADIAKLLKYRDETALQTALGKAGCLLTPASGPALLTLKPSCAMYCGPAAAQATLQGWLDDTLLPAQGHTLIRTSCNWPTHWPVRRRGRWGRRCGSRYWRGGGLAAVALAGFLALSGRAGQRRPSGKTVALQAEVSTLAALAECVAAGGVLPVSTRELIKLAAACHLRLAERMQKQALRA